MDHKKPSLVNNQYYSKKILQIYWWMVLVAFVGQFGGLLINDYYLGEQTFFFINKTLLLPTGIQIFILLIVHGLIKYRKIYSANLLIVVGTGIAFVAILRYPDMTSLQVFFLLMMAISLLYFDKEKLKISFIVNIIGLTALYAFPSIQMTTNAEEYTFFMFILIVGYMVFGIIVNRGNEALQVLQQAAETERQLIVKSTMMERLAKIDALTNLYNHKTFHDYLDFLYEQSISQGMSLHLAMIDIDNFKSINDRYGHNIGDVAIQRVAQVLSENVTENDIVARYGGEEFAILLTNKTLSEAYDIVENIRLEIANQSHQELDETLTVSVGLQSLDEDISKAKLFQRADKLLYKAKQKGKNQVMMKANSMEKGKDENYHANPERE